jgi:Fe-S-cluster containining protein
VTILDRQEIQRGLRALPETHRNRINRTVAEQVSVLTVAVPRLKTSPFIDQWSEEDIDRVGERFETWPCPALEQDGTCGLYEFRPLACRSMGIPTDNGLSVNGACAVQTAVPLIRLSKAVREEENYLAGMEAKELEALRRQQGAQGEELLLPFAFLPDDAPAGRITESA